LRPRLERTAKREARKREERFGKDLLSYVFDHVPAPEEAADYVEDPRAESPHQQFESVVISTESSANLPSSSKSPARPGVDCSLRFDLT